MSKYSKAQEDRMESKLKDLGFTVIEDTARRKKHHADRIMRHDDSGLIFTVDHKSTIGKKSTRVELEWFDKVAEEAEPNTIPAITLSFKNSQKLIVCMDANHLLGMLYG